MAKRTRGTSRPGQMRPARRADRAATKPAPAAEPARAAATLTADDEARAAELESQIMGTGTAAVALKQKGGIVRSRSKESSLLAAKADLEYTYVQRDVRRIAKVDGGLVVVLFILFILIDITGIIKL
jgi:hypothetical protein